MKETTSTRLYRRITRLRWQVPLLAFLLVLTHQIAEHTWLVQLPRWYHFATQLLFYGLVGPTMAWVALSSLRRSVRETETAERALQQAHDTLGELNQRLAFLIQVNRRLAEAGDEETLAELILELPQQVVPVVSCSFIRFDERHQPLPAIHRGQVESTALDAWAAHLADARVREQCACCHTHTAVPSDDSCPLLAHAPENLPIAKVHCLPLARNNREYGVLNIFLADSQHPTEQEASLLDALAQEMTLALESQQLRDRELAMLSRLQQASRLSNLRQDLQDVLGGTMEALEADGIVLFIRDTATAVLQPQLEAGRPLADALPLVKGMADGMEQADAPLIIHDLEQAGATAIRSLLIAPLHTDGQTLGALALWAARPEAFIRRHAQLIAIVAGQAALLVENQRLYLRGEQQAALAERARLAREIHDGLAQTLGYLKLRASLAANLLREGQTERALTDLNEVQTLLSAAATDAREAIDGLRLKAEVTDLRAWLAEIIAEFEMLSGIPVTAVSPPDVGLPLEVHAQLQRIVQESLSNVRKHADATRVWLEWQQEEQWLILHIRDNGHGFDPDDVPPIARHGLRIMRERAELLQADFQITSHLNAGTKITARLPLPKVVAGERNA